jgi:hypothetical protein
MYARFPEVLHVKPCPDGHPDHRLLQVDDTVTAELALPRGSLLHLDRHRAPRNGDVVLAEVVVQQRRTQTVRRFTQAENVVSLARIIGPDSAGRLGRQPSVQSSLIRPRYEVGILGVVDGHVVPLDQP